MLRMLFGIWYVVTYWGFVLSLIREQDFFILKIVIGIVALFVYMAITRFLNIFDNGGEFWRGRY